jgi:hypothetical protein
LGSKKKGKRKLENFFIKRKVRNKNKKNKRRGGKINIKNKIKKSLFFSGVICVPNGKKKKIKI